MTIEEQIQQLLPAVEMAISNGGKQTLIDLNIVQQILKRAIVPPVRSFYYKLDREMALLIEPKNIKADDVLFFIRFDGDEMTDARRFTVQSVDRVGGNIYPVPGTETDYLSDIHI